MKTPFKLLGLTEEHKEFLYNYSQNVLGSKSRTKAILHIINEKMDKDFNLNLVGNYKVNEKKKRVQLSLRVSDYGYLLEICKNTDMSIPNYIIRLILNNIYSSNVKLLGKEIEVLRISNYEIHKIGVNLNQISKNINSGYLNSNGIDLNDLTKKVDEHIKIVSDILKNNLEKY